MRVSPRRIKNKLKRYKVSHVFVNGWDSNRVDPYNGNSDFEGIVLHHTAGTNSLNYIVNTNPYAPIRACHFYVDRKGKVHVVAKGAYHAGSGGPYTFRKGRKGTVTVRHGNSQLWGIEIESKGTSRKIDGSPEGMTVEQVVSTAQLCAALLNAGRRGWKSWPVTRVIRHRDWAPRRKIDVLQDLRWWHDVIGIARRHRKEPDRARALIRGYVLSNPSGKWRRD